MIRPLSRARAAVALALTLAHTFMLPAAAEPAAPRLVADIPPVAALVAAVAGRPDAPPTLIEGPTDPHHAHLRPSAARVLAEADLVIWIGPEFTPWLERTLDRLAPGARRLALLDAPGTLARAPLFAGDDDHDQHLGRAAAGDRAAAHDGGVARDPHAWLDPVNAMAWLDAIAEALAAEAPEQAARYRANAAAARGRIAAALKRAEERLAPLRGVALVVAHDAWSHFADRFGLTVLGALADTHSGGTGAASLADLRAKIAGAGPVCLVAEAQEPSAPLARLSADTGRPLVTLDPLGSTLPPGPELYERLIAALADGLAGCLAPS